MNQVREEHKYERHILALQELSGFYDKWCTMIPDYKTHEAAYESLEKMYLYYFGKRRYKNFETFAVSISKWRASNAKNR